MDNKYKIQFNQMKKERRQKKRCVKRSITGEEVIFIFEKFIEGWTTIRIYNTIIQNDKNSTVNKKQVETIVSGNCKVYENELSSEKYKHYLKLREKIYELHNTNKIIDDLENNIYPEKGEHTLPKYVSLIIAREKPHLVFEKRLEDKRLNIKMVLPEEYDLQEQLSILNDKIKAKYEGECVL